MIIKFPESIAKALAVVDPALAGEVYQAIMAYAFDGTEPSDLTSTAEALFILAKEMIRPAASRPEARKSKPMAEPQSPQQIDIEPARVAGQPSGRPRGPEPIVEDGAFMIYDLHMGCGYGDEEEDVSDGETPQPWYCDD